MTAVFFRIKEKNACTKVVYSFYHVSESHVVDRIQVSIEDIVHWYSVWLEIFRDEAEEHFPNYTHDMLETKKLNLGNSQGERVSLDTCPTALKLGKFSEKNRRNRRIDEHTN